MFEPRGHAARATAGVRHAAERDAARGQTERAAASHCCQPSPQTVIYILAFNFM